MQGELKFYYNSIKPGSHGVYLAVIDIQRGLVGFDVIDAGLLLLL